MINVLAIVGCILSMTCSLACALGRLRAVYVVSIVNGCLFAGLNAAIALASPDQKAMALMIVPSVWLILTSVYGLWRVRRKRASVRP